MLNCVLSETWQLDVLMVWRSPGMWSNPFSLRQFWILFFKQKHFFLGKYLEDDCQSQAKQQHFKYFVNIFDNPKLCSKL